jgi:hypothetical protein
MRPHEAATSAPVAPADYAARVELHVGPTPPRGNALPALVRWLRAVRDRRAARPAAEGGER